MSSQPSRNGASREELRLLWRMAGLGFQFGTEIIAGVLLGWAFDAWLGTQPWGVVVGAVAGILVATLDLVRRAVQLNRSMDASDRARLTRNNAGDSPGQAATDEAPADDDALDSEFDEAMNHEQWKSLQDKRLSSKREDERDST